MKLSGRTILLTGGSTGIGLAFAKKFVELGNEVIITGRSQAKLDAAKAEAPKLHTISSDAADPEAVRELGKRMQADFPNLDVVMNNAGVFVSRNLARPQDDDGLLEVDVNVNGPIRTISATIEQLKKNRGTIINVSSGLAFVPLYSAPVYCATKAALHSYTISLRLQLKEHGVEVIELMPPAVQTDMTAEFHGAEGFDLMTTQQLIEASIKGLKKGDLEIRPGQSNQLHWKSRIAPGFITGELSKAAKAFIPA